MSQFRTALLKSKFSLELGSIITFRWLILVSLNINKYWKNLWRAIKGLKAKDKCENSFLSDDKMEIIFTAFDVKVRKDDLDMCPLKFCHKCYKLALRGGTRLAVNV